MLHTRRTRRACVAGLTAAVLIVTSMGSGGSVSADPAPRKGIPAPDATGDFSIGHTTVNIVDPNRNLDGSTPATGEGRYLHLDIWYPTNVSTDEHVTYTWNNPLYNENPGGTVFPGLPDLAPMTSPGSRSLNPVLEGAPLADGDFPLLVGSHGNLVSSAKNMPDTMEILASHGYVVMSVEHTGNDDAWYQADWLGRRLGLPIGPNPSIAAQGNILQRTKDVSFVIDAALDGVVDAAAGVEFSDEIDADAIGVLGFSLGGMTSLATVTGIGSAGSAPDPRVKAAVMGGGTNYGLLLDADDYANARVPLMFLGNDTGIAYDSFNEFTGAREKYLVDIADFNHHVGGYQSSWCQDFQGAMEVVDPSVFPGVFFGAAPSLDPSKIADYIFAATFYFVYTGARQSGVWDYCEPSVLDDVSDAQLTAVNFGNPSILSVRDELIGSMPLKPEASVAEISRVTSLYTVSFFNSVLQGERSYRSYLNPSERMRRDNPTVDLVQNCLKVPARPIDLVAGDAITFTPKGDDGYDVGVRSGVPFYDEGTTALAVGGEGVAELPLAGFSFPVPGMDPVDTLVVNENGVISTLTTPDIGAIDDNGSPWYMQGHLMLSAQFTIGALMKDLTAGTGGGTVFGRVDDDRVVVTYRDVPSAGTTAPNTLQIAIDRSGTIELIVGELAATGTAYAPGILGTLGIAGGHTKVADLRDTRSFDFSAIRDRGPVFVPFDSEAAIFEQYVDGTGPSCRR